MWKKNTIINHKEQKYEGGHKSSLYHMDHRHSEPASEFLQRLDSRMFHYLKADPKSIFSLEHQTDKDGYSETRYDTETVIT